MKNLDENPNTSALEESDAKLYTPEDFQKLLLKAFNIYITGEGDIEAEDAAPSELDAAQVKTLANSEEQQPVQQGYGFFGAFGDYVGKTAVALASTAMHVASKTYQARKQHMAVTEFVKQEMESIIAQQASSLTKMTNLSILFYGLYSYLSSARNSKTLLPLLNYVDKMLWKSVPITMKTPEMEAAINRIKINHEQILSGNEQTANTGVEAGLNEHHINFLTSQIRKCTQSDDDNKVQADRLLFMLAFVNQIVRAHTLVSQHKGLTTLINPLQSSYETNNATEITQDNIGNMLPWRYRCNSDDNMTTWTTPGLLPFVYPRMPQYGDSLIPVIACYKLEHYLDMTVPLPYMGDTYGQFLANHDNTLAVTPSQLDNVDEQNQGLPQNNY